MNFSRLSILFLCLQLMAEAPLAAAERPGLEPETFIQWSSASIERLTDGRVSLVLTLESSRPELTLENPAAFFKLTRQPRRYRELAIPEGPESYGLDWERSPEGLKITIFSGEYARATIFARVEIEGRPHYAQTAFNLYGRSRTEVGPEPKRLLQAPDWPEFSLKSDAPLYWPQTGQEFTFKFAGGENEPAKSLAVWDRGRQVAKIEPGPDCFPYRPERDPSLDRAGYRASKPLAFVVPGDGGGSASFTLFVHRSRQAGLNLPAGLGVFAAGFLAAGVPVGLARRRFKICA